MFAYNKYGAGVTVIVGWHDLLRIIETETCKFYKEHPEQFEDLESAKEFAPIRFTMLGHKIAERCKESLPHFESYIE